MCGALIVAIYILLFTYRRYRSIIYNCMYVKKKDIGRLFSISRQRFAINIIIAMAYPNVTEISVNAFTSAIR